MIGDGRSELNPSETTLTMKVSGMVMVILALILSIINLGLFFVCVSLIDIEMVQPGPGSEYVLSHLSLQITVLEVVLVVIGIVLAVLGLWGYQGVKDAAVNKSLEVTEKQVQEHLNRLQYQDKMDTSQIRIDETNVNDRKAEEIKPEMNV